MRELASYSHHVFATLTSLADADVRLKSLNIDLDELGHMLQKYDLHRVAGIALLHRHFAVGQHERLIEQLDYVSLTSTTSPREAESGRMEPHLLRVGIGDASGSYVWQPLEFVVQTHARALCRQGLQRVAESGKFLDDMVALLERRGALDVLGISILHGREELLRRPSDVLLEGAGETPRTLTLTPADEHDPEVAAGIQTVWMFDGGRCRMSCTCQKSQGDHAHLESN